jgi:hypothetical protein
VTITVASFGGEAAAPAALDWQLPVGHLSPSSLKMAMRCPRQWQERYIAGRKERPGAAVTLGSAEWDAHVINYEQKRTSGVDLPDITDAYAESWDAAVAKNGGLGEIKWNDGQDWTDVQTLGLNMAKTYHAQVSPRIQPLTVEMRVEFPIAGIPVPVLGFIDLCQANTTVEHKTGAKALSKPKTEWTFQNRIYQTYTRQGAEVHLVTKAKEPKVITPLEQPEMFLPYNEVQAKATEKLVANVAWNLNHYYTTLGPDEPWPQHGVVSDWACGWCAYRGNCPAWRTT